MADVVGAAAERPAVPFIVDVEGERRMHADRRMKRIGRSPRAIAHARDVLTRHPGCAQRQAIAVAGDDVARVVQPLDLDLQALDRAVDVTHGAAAARLLAQHVPGFQRMA